MYVVLFGCKLDMSRMSLAVDVPKADSEHEQILTVLVGR